MNYILRHELYSTTNSYSWTVSQNILQLVVNNFKFSSRNIRLKDVIK